MDKDKSNSFLERCAITCESGAIMLAITTTMYDEGLVKKHLEEHGYKAGATETGGNAQSKEFAEKLTKAVLGVALNSNIIKRDAPDMHAVLHSTQEALSGLLNYHYSSTSLAIKIAVVRKDRWLVVCLYGQSALHFMTNHRRIGLGIMHI